MFHESTHRRQFFLLRHLLPVITLFISSVLFAQTDSSQYFLQKGLDEKQKGRRSESLRNFEKANKYDSKNKAVLTELAVAYLDQRKYHQAIQTYKKLVELGDKTAANYKQLLKLSFNLKQYEDVELYANKLKQADPTEKINYYLGKVNFERDNYGEAFKYLNAATKEEPNNGEIPYMIGRAYADMQNYKLAIPYYKRAIELDDTKFGWIYELGMISYAYDDSKAAVKYFKLAAEKGYTKDNAYHENLGIAHLDAGDFDEGTSILNELLKKRPSDFNLLNMLAEAYYYKGKYNEAIDYWDIIFGYDKTNAEALYMIGMCYQKKGEKSKGMQLCDKAIEMDPKLASLKQKKELPGGF